MKKILLFVIGLAFLAACKDPEKVCKIEGHDCWEVIQLLTKTKKDSPNPDLEAMGLKVYFHDTSNKNTINATINDEVDVQTGANPNKAYMIVYFHDSRRHFFFDQKGKIKFYSKFQISPDDCKIEDNEDYTPKQTYKYKTPAELEAMGLKISHADMYLDGGSTIIVLNDKVSIFTNRSMSPDPQDIQADAAILRVGPQYNSKYGYVTITFVDDGREFVFDPQGNLKSYPQSKNTSRVKSKACKIEGNDCWKVAQLAGKTKINQKIKSIKDGEIVMMLPSISYENLCLADINLKVSDQRKFYTGTTITTINGKFIIHKNRMPGISDYGNTTVAFKEDGRKFVFDKKGKLKEYIQPKKVDNICQIEGNDCWKIVQILNEEERKHNAARVLQDDSSIE